MFPITGGVVMISLHLEDFCGENALKKHDFERKE